MTYYGILVGLGVFIIIGALHPVVIKAEYYLGKGCWPAFAVSGILCCAASLLVNDLTVSVLLGVLAFSLFWSIHEIFEQEKRVQKGWYPANPARVNKKNEDNNK